MRRARAPRWLAALVLVTQSTSVCAFSFNISEPTQCGQTFLRWYVPWSLGAGLELRTATAIAQSFWKGQLTRRDGGTPPYELIMVPVSLMLTESL